MKVKMEMEIKEISIDYDWLSETTKIKVFKKFGEGSNSMIQLDTFNTNDVPNEIVEYFNKIKTYFEDYYKQEDFR